MAIKKNITIKTPKGKREIGPGRPVFIIAEMSGNHNQDINRAYKIIDATAAAGVDAVKSQTYTADTITIDSDNELFQIKNSKLWSGQTLHQLYQTAYTPWDWQPKLKKYAEAKGLVFFSTPFDNTAVDFLEKMKVELYKVASLEVVDIPLLKRIGRTKKPVIMSRGAATINEIRLAVKTLKANGTPQVAVLQCVAAYPAKPEDMNIKIIPDISRRFRVISGLSDHSLSTNTVIAAVALGASIIEKHVTLARADGGPDSAFSLEAGELKQLVKSVREIEQALGEPKYGVGKSEAESAILRKSLFAVKDIKKGEKFTEDNVRSIRPGAGLEPKFYDKIMGKIAKLDIKRATPLSWNLIK